MVSRGGRSARLALAGLLVIVLAPPASDAAPSITVPRGYRVTSRRSLARGVDYFTMVRSNPREVVYIARFNTRSGYKLSPVMSRDQIAESGVRTETTSSMCKRVHCLVAINGDFFSAGVPIGGQITNTEIVRTPTRIEDQVTMAPDGRMSLGRLNVTTTLVGHHGIYLAANGSRLIWHDTSTDEFAIAGINGARGPSQLELYTPRFGPRTLTSGGGVELVVRNVGGPAWRPGETVLQAVALRGANSPIPRDGGIVSGRGSAGDALRAYWNDLQAGKANPDLQIIIGSSPGADASIGGYPTILRGSRRVFPKTGLTSTPAPRSIVGWTPRGDVYIVAFDGRQPGWADGVTLSQAADFLRALGVTDALNFDGGSSTTFVVGGKVTNRVSERIVIRNGVRKHVVFGQAGDRTVSYIERWVANALTIVKG